MGLSAQAWTRQCGGTIVHYLPASACSHLQSQIWQRRAWRRQEENLLSPFCHSASSPAAALLKLLFPLAQPWLLRCLHQILLLYRGLPDLERSSGCCPAVMAAYPPPPPVPALSLLWLKYLVPHSVAGSSVLDDRVSAR